jgi:structural maintenance of chromosome 4
MKRLGEKVAGLRIIEKEKAKAKAKFVAERKEALAWVRLTNEHMRAQNRLW